MTFQIKAILYVAKVSKILFFVTTLVLSSLRCTKIRFCPGSAPDPAGAVCDVPPDLLVGWGTEHPFPFPSLRRL